MSNDTQNPIGWSLIHEAHAQRSIVAVHAARNGGTGYVVGIGPEGFTLMPAHSAGDDRRHILWGDVFSVYSMPVFA